MWQDYALTLGLIVFNLALIPAIFSKYKPPLITSMPTVVFQYLFAVTFITLHLWFSAVGSFINGTLWGILAYQKYKGRSRSKKK